MEHGKGGAWAACGMQLSGGHPRLIPAKLASRKAAELGGVSVNRAAPDEFIK